MPYQIHGPFGTGNPAGFGQYFEGVPGKNQKGNTTVPGLGGLGAGTKGTATKWTMDPSQVAAQYGLMPATNQTYQSNAPMGQNYGFNTGGNAGGGGTATKPFMSAAANDAAYVAGPSNMQTTVAAVPQFNRADANTNILDDGSVPGTSALSGIADTTSGSDPSSFRFNGSDTQYSVNDVTNMNNDPLQFMREFLNQRGLDSPTARSAMGNYYQFLPALTAFFMSQGNKALTDQDRIAGISDQLLENYITPGGRGPDAAEMLRQIMRNGTIENGNSTGANMLQQMYAGGDQATQVQNITGLWNAATGGLPGAYGKAIQDAMANLAGDWKMASMDSRNAAVGTANPYNTSFADFLETDPLARRFAGL